MKKHLLAWVLIAVSAAATPLRAQDICEAVLKRGIRDSSKTFSYKENYDQAHAAACNESTTTYSGAKKSGGTLGVNVIDIVDISLGGSSDETTWSDRRQKFCSSSYDEHYSNSALENEVSHINTAVVSAWESCVAKSNGFLIWVEPSGNLGAFTLKIRNRTGRGTFEINSYKGEPPVKCTDLDDAGLPYESKTTELSMVCTKDPNQTTAFNIRTSEGDSPAIDMMGARTRLEELQSQVIKLSEELATNKSRVDDLVGDLGSLRGTLKVYAADSPGNPFRGPLTTKHAQCPPGQYVTGVTFRNVGGKEGKVISGAVVCRSLNTGH